MDTWYGHLWETKFLIHSKNEDQLVTGTSQVKNKDKPQHTEMTLPKCIDLFSPKTFFSKTVVQLLLPASIMFALFFPEITALSVIGGGDI